MQEEDGDNDEDDENDDFDEEREEDDDLHDDRMMDRDEGGMPLAGQAEEAVPERTGFESFRKVSLCCTNYPSSYFKSNDSFGVPVEIPKYFHVTGPPDISDPLQNLNCITGFFPQQCTLSLATSKSHNIYNNITASYQKSLSRQHYKIYDVRG